MISPLDDSAQAEWSGPIGTVTDAAIRVLFERNKAEHKTKHKVYVLESLRELNESPSDRDSLLKAATRQQGLSTRQQVVTTIPQQADSAGIKLVQGDSYRVWKHGMTHALTERAPQAVEVDEGIMPAPGYELCAPATTNHLWDWSDGISVDFLPFPDDPNFNHTAYLFGKTSKWENLDRNVNDDSAYVDTVNTLVTDYGMTDREVRKRFAEPAFFPLLKYGQVMSTSEAFLEKQSSLNPSYGSTDLICNLPHCLLPNCIHIQARKFYGVKRVTVDETYRPTPPASRCGRTCYRNSRNIIEETLEDWDSDKQAILEAGLDVAPYATSCELAASCGSTCLQVHLHRLRLYHPTGSEGHQDFRNFDRRTRLASVSVAKFDKYKGTPFFIPCQHEGPCDNGTCACFSMHKRCGRFCGCPPQCPRKPVPCEVGCRCNTVHCACFEQARECDPEVCHNGAIRAGGLLCCPNVALQRGKPPRTLTKLSDYGWGLFADEDILKGQFIGEYVGEYIRIRRENMEYPVAEHLQRSYAFEVTEKWSINSLWVGNNTRYMNHRSGLTCNVDTRVLSVNGDIRLGFFAGREIRQGTELTIDYGEEFGKLLAKASKMR